MLVSPWELKTRVHSGGQHRCPTVQRGPEVPGGLPSPYQTDGCGTEAHTWSQSQGEVPALGL